MRLQPSRFVFAFFILVVSLHHKLYAQTATSGGLTGVVTDATGAVLPGADIEIRDHNKGTTLSTRTDRQGGYEFFFLWPSRYILTVAHAGFRTEKRDVNVLLGPPVSVNVALEIAQTSTSVTVTAEAPLLHAEDGDVSDTMNQKQVSEVPNPGNDLTYIVQTAPGVVMSTDSSINTIGHFSILGMPGTSYRYTIDGTNNSDNGTNINRNSGLGLFLGQNQIQEATIVSTGYSAQFGGAAGGDINYISKSGTNAIHGNAQYFWNGRVLNANNWFNKEAGNPRPIDIDNQWATSLGAPLHKDKLFLFLDSEGVRLLIPQFSTVVIPSPEFEATTIANIDADPRFGPNSATDAFYRHIFDLYNAAPGADRATKGGFDLKNDPTGCGAFPALPANMPCALNFLSSRSRTSSETLTSGRVDWNISQHDRAFLRVQFDHGLGAFFTDTISPLFDADFDVPWWQGSVIETHTFGSTAANQFLAAASYWAPIYKVANFSQALSAFPTVLDFGATGSFTNLGGLDWIGVSGRYNRQFQFSDDFVRTWGSHKLGVGANFERTWWTTLPNDVNATGQLTPISLDAFFQGGVDPSSSDFTLLTQSFTLRTSIPISFFNLGIYGEDEWRPKSGLSLTLGLRVEHYSNPVCQTRCFARLKGPFESVTHDPDQPYDKAISTNQKHAFLETDRILWSPRFSFAWQPFGISRNTVIRGGFGLFYDGLPGIEESFYLNAPQYNTFTISGDNLTPNEKPSNLFQAAKASNNAFVNAFNTGEKLADIQAIPGFSPPAINASARTLHSPRFQKWSLELQHAFGAQTSINIGYFGNHGIHELVLNRSANAFGFGTLPAQRCSIPPIPPCADPRFSQITEDTTDAVSNYNGMVISFQRQFARFGSGILQANYTYGHAFDEVSNGGVFSFTSVGLTNPQSPANLLGSYGSAEYDVRHSFNANYVWELPIEAALRGHGPESIVKGWQISGTVFARTGFPYTVIDTALSDVLRQNNYFGTVYAVPAKPLGPGSSCGRGAAYPLAAKPCQPQQFSVQPYGGSVPNPNALFVQARCETGFNTGHLGAFPACDGHEVSFAQGRNRFRGPGYFNTDLAITKKTKIPGWENATLGLGFQFFNLFNHPNFGFPDNSVSSATFGQIFYLEQSPTSILGTGLGGDASPRMIQLKAEIQF